MKIVFLGTNGWYDNAAGNTVCTLIDAPEGDGIPDAASSWTRATASTSWTGT